MGLHLRPSVEKYYRDAKVFSIYEGTSEIQRLLIGRAIAEQKGREPLHYQQPQRNSAPA
jgi:acyl-CoA dehydrogenase